MSARTARSPNSRPSPAASAAISTFLQSKTLATPFRASSLVYTHRSAYQEDHRNSLYCAAFNMCDARFAEYVATVGGTCATVYECMPDGALRPHCVFRDPDANEYLYCVAWSHDRADGRPLGALVNNAGIFDMGSSKPGRDDRGHEAHWGTNYLVRCLSACVVRRAGT